MSVFSERVKELRKAKKQSQNEVGKALGKSRESISKYELGEREPDTNVIALLAKHFNVSSDYMLGITDHSEKEAVDNSKFFGRKLSAFESYLRNDNFIPYLQLAVKMKDSNIESDKFKTLIYKYIEQEKHR
jgi:transcriptional regulator with XRE-family HTH domain